MTVMTCGMAHVSGGMMAAYLLFGVEAKHLLAAVIMTAPGTLVIAKMLVRKPGRPRRWERSGWKRSGPTSTSSMRRRVAREKA
jgi:nucleoside permease NupC